MIRLARWFIVVAGSILLLLGLVASLASRTPAMRQQLVSTLASKLDAEVELGSFSASIFPTINIDGEHVTIRRKGRRNRPPLISIARFHADGGLLGLISSRRRFSTVHLDGLEITIEPHDDDAKSHDGDARDPDGLKKSRGQGRNAAASRVIIDRIISHDAKLTIVPRNPEKEPKVFAIRHLSMTGVGFDREMPFRATLTNPIPRGDIDATGTFGPWSADEPGATPVSGRYSFRNVDLGTIKGIGGALESTGDFAGVLQRIGVKGTTTTPDFSIDVGGAPLPLNTRFDATVDGTSGDTFLNLVDARLAETPIVARGAIAGTPGVKGRTIKLDVRIDKGRIEDALRLAVNSPKPVMTGAMDLTTSLLLPPGEASVPDRLQLDGRFSLTRGHFENEVQQKLVALSRHGRGLDNGDPAGRVVSDLHGAFALQAGALRFTDLVFSVPGALVRVKGTYGLRKQTLDFAGDLRMDATVSQAAGGWKSIVLKPFDPLFKRNGKGAVVPIHIKGTRQKPDVGLDYGRIIATK